MITFRPPTFGSWVGGTIPGPSYGPYILWPWARLPHNHVIPKVDYASYSKRYLLTGRPRRLESIKLASSNLLIDVNKIALRPIYRILWQPFSKMWSKCNFSQSLRLLFQSRTAGNLLRSLHDLRTFEENFGLFPWVSTNCPAERQTMYGAFKLTAE
eukprot:106329-Amphidinium_carterae.1